MEAVGADQPDSKIAPGRATVCAHVITVDGCVERRASRINTATAVSREETGSAVVERLTVTPDEEPPVARVTVAALPSVDHVP